MLMRDPGAAAGFSLIELMITLAVLGIVMAIGLPNISVWIQNTQIKTAAEGMVSGLQLARAEALRRNAVVRFHLVTTVANGCALSSADANWVVSLGIPTGVCGAAPSDDPATPQIVQKKSGTEGSPNAIVAANGNSVVVFNGLGRPFGLGNITQIDIGSNGGACQPLLGAAGTGTMRCLSVLIGNGGQLRMCDRAATDPAVANPTDTRSCGSGFIPLLP